MDELDDILRRLKRLEDSTVRFRQGEVTATAPLSVAIGGSAVPFDGVAAHAGMRLDAGDVVGALQFGNDMLVLGQVGDPGGLKYFAAGVGSVTFSASQVSDQPSISHGLVNARGIAITPTAVVCTTFDWNNKVAAFTLTSTTFQAKGKYDTVVSGAAPFFWIAVA